MQSYFETCELNSFMGSLESGPCDLILMSKKSLWSIDAFVHAFVLLECLDDLSWMFQG